jgi:hypothetical protein
MTLPAERILAIHRRIRDEIVRACEQQSSESLARVTRDDEGDTIFAVDLVSEELVLEAFAELARETSFLLVGEGVPGGSVALGGGEAELTVVVDPIDGTRGLMYQKRSAWILTGVAPVVAEGTLDDIVLAVQTEIPLVKQHLSDEIVARRGAGLAAWRYDRCRGTRTPLELRPSRASTIEQGFAMIARFFPGARDVLAAIDEEIVIGALGPAPQGKTHCFEDQYISAGGQLYELAVGHDRFVADLRPLLGPVLAERGLPLGIAAHPYDLCTALVAQEAGAIVVSPDGTSLGSPLDVTADVAWAGYANEEIRRQVEPLLQTALQSRGLL